MKIIILVTLLAASPNLFAQRPKDISFIKQHARLNPKNIYIFCRGTKSKSNLIAHHFNISDTNITHTGIAVIKRGTLFIYNVVDNSALRSALVIDSIASFISSKDVYYLGIWECSNNTAELAKAMQLVKTYSSRRIFFDTGFYPGENDTLYCSEFCVHLLTKINQQKFNFRPRAMPLNNSLYESILGRKLLTYFPVDFFESNHYFKKIFEYRFR